MNSTRAVAVNIQAVSPELRVSSAKTTEGVSNGSVALAVIKNSFKGLFIRISPYVGQVYIYRAVDPVSPVRIRTACSTSRTKILPSPILPVLPDV